MALGRPMMGRTPRELSLVLISHPFCQHFLACYFDANLFTDKGLIIPVQGAHFRYTVHLTSSLTKQGSIQTSINPISSALFYSCLIH